MRRLWPHLLLRLHLIGLALSWMSLVLLLALGGAMIIEQSVYLDMSSESVKDHAWQYNHGRLYWYSPRLEIHHSQTVRPERYTVPLNGVVRKLNLRRGSFVADSVLHSVSQRSFCGIAWSIGHAGSLSGDREWALALHWPYPLLALALPALPALYRIYRWLVQRYRIPAHACPNCHYDLRATPGRCPECGTAVSFDPHTGRHIATGCPTHRRAWLARAAMSISIFSAIATIGIWNTPPRWIRSPHPMGPHLWLADHQAICMLRYSNQGTTGISGQWHYTTLGLWAQVDGSATVLWIPYWLPLAIAMVAPARAIWRHIRYGPPPRCIRPAPC